jgi:uncharacterized protein YjbJ (UPF0337 family)
MRPLPLFKLVLNLRPNSQKQSIMNERENIDWEDLKEKLKEAIPHLTDEDLDANKGNVEQLVAWLAAKMDRTREDVAGWIDSVAFTKGRAF